MSLVVTEPEMPTAKARRVDHAAVAAPATGVAPAAADEVSVLTAAQFTAHAGVYQAVRAQTGFQEVFQEMLLASLDSGAGWHAASEATDAAIPQTQGQGLVADFAAVPPEIHSTRMHTGPGSGPMLAAAAAWDELASELNWAAAGCDSVVSGLKGGRSALATAAAAPYLRWVHATAAKAEQAAAQAKAAAAAFESALSMTVPPAVIAANRSLLKLLAASNFLGQHAPAIATTEGHYGEMWAQNAAAMYGYAGAAAAASALAPFTLPPSGSDATRVPGEPAARTASAETAAQAGTSAHTVLSELMSAVPEALGSLASPLSSPRRQLSSLASRLDALDAEFGVPPHTRSTSTVNSSPVVGAIKLLAAAITALAPEVNSAAGGADTAAPAGGSGADMSVRLGQAARVGTLSVPRVWAISVPAVRPAAPMLHSTAATFEPPITFVFGIA
ncbi:PPE domain-containing protein [Mycobacterium sp. SM1]|uniref:PPE family protein, SVP subgroup n=1 Tax=Mycobacterium sp. SM1 TaxID=2816243 RepID=UPI001BCD6257|nr:PPE domain-containing protein [Mycobacterium sp. SM1]MBS4727706.1 PPE domain-containing protein [Mycobacterium sp. SM1]